MAFVDKTPKAQSSAQPSATSDLDGLATILAIGTANPPAVFKQHDFPDYYFQVTKSPLAHLKPKLKSTCKKSMIEERHMYLTEDIIEKNPKLRAYDEPSLDARQDMVAVAVPELGEKAASKAIEEWGRPKSEITHLIFCSSYCAIEMPGADQKLIKLLGLKLSTKSFMLYHHACSGGGAVLRLAKDLAENNAGARVLVVCSEITSITFRGPCEADLSSLAGQALFGDGAVAVIVGSRPKIGVERPLYHLVSASRMILPDSEGSIEARLREVGYTFHFKENIPQLIADNIEKILKEAFSPIGKISDWNSLFWIVHPGGAATLKRIEERIGLKEGKLGATKQVLKEYGNMSSASVLFVLDEMRRKSVKERKATTGEGLEWGVLHAFGPGLTTETLVLHSARNP